MRLWSFHPTYLDTPGLTALWRESLLAQRVLKGETKGYKNHPQLERFKRHPRPREAIAAYLSGVWDESRRRGFSFDKRKIGRQRRAAKLTVTRGQLTYEFALLCEKLGKRNPEECRELLSLEQARPHPLFRVVRGEIEKWERVKENTSR